MAMKGGQTAIAASVRKAGGRMEIQKLGDKMKALEKAQDPPRLRPTEAVMARIDGRKFSTFTKGFTKPFDPRLARAMSNSMLDLTKEFQASIGYTQSDEITLVWPAVTTPEEDDDTKVHMFGGRVIKTATVLAGYASARFAHHLAREHFQANESHLADRIPLAHFDSRVFNVPDTSDVIENLLWRHKFDCKRNAVANYFMHTFSHKAAEGNGTNEKLQILRDAGHNYDDLPPEFRFGVFGKRELNEVEAFNPKTGESSTALRTTVKARSFPLHRVEEELQSEVVMGKYWPREAGAAGNPNSCSPTDGWVYARVVTEPPAMSEPSGEEGGAEA